MQKALDVCRNWGHAVYEKRRPPAYGEEEEEDPALLCPDKEMSNEVQILNHVKGNEYFVQVRKPQESRVRMLSPATAHI